MTAQDGPLLKRGAKMNHRIARVSVHAAAAAVVLLAGCTYSFKGGSLPPHLKTVAIPVADDQSGYGDPTLRDAFTRRLDSLIISDNTLRLTDRNTADCSLEGVITDVKDVPEVLQGTDQVSQRRVTVTVRMTFTDLKLRKKIWEKNFSGWGDYPSGGGGFTQRNTGVQTAVQKLTDDILTDTVSGW